MSHSTATTPVLDVAYEEHGSAGGQPAVLLHGFPYDVRAYDEVVPILAAAGVRVIVPWLRGYGPTRFRSADVPRSGQQGAIGQDLIDLIDVLGLDQPVVAGYDWGGRAACIAAAVVPDRVRGLVTVGGWNIQDIAAGAEPRVRDFDPGLWYQYYLHSEKGRRGLDRHREEFCSTLWRLWSPEWTAADAAFAASAPSFANPDFVDVVVHSYRHRHGLATGDPRYDAIEAVLAAAPVIRVPTIAVDALADGLGADDSAADRDRFGERFEVRRLPGIGHNVPQEAPGAFAETVLALL